MSSIPGPPAAPRVFRRGWVGAIIGAIIASAVVILIALLVIPDLLPVTTSRGVRATLALAVAVIGVGLVWFSAFWLRNIRVEVTPDAVEVRRPGQVLHRIERQGTEFSGHVTKQRTNGIPTGKLYRLIARAPSEGFTAELPGFRARTFELLLATLHAQDGPIIR